MLLELGIQLALKGLVFAIKTFRTNKDIQKNNVITKNKIEFDNAHTANIIAKGHEANKDKIEYDNSHSANIIEQGHEKNRDKMDYDNNHTENVIKVLKAKSEIKIDEHEKILKQNDTYRLRSQKENVVLEQHLSLRTWGDYFHSQYAMPDYRNIPLLKSVLDGCPEGFKDPMMFHILTSLGAICFSKVRAKYDDVMRAPNLLTVIEGKQGSGKSKFDTVNKTLFQRIIEQDREKSANGLSERIIQTVGFNITMAKFIDMLAANKGVHLYAMETEFSRMSEVAHNKRVISFIELRKAFDNEEIEQFNKNRRAKQGRYPVYLNSTLTGTPEAINKAFNKKEVNEGSARRFCFTVIPEPDAQCKKLRFPQGDELEAIRDQIDKWRNTYCFYHDPIKGEVPCNEYEIDLDYVAEALEAWAQTQYKLYTMDKLEMRNEVRFGIATTAFHNAIVLHMLAGNPDATQKALRKTVKQLALYIANYCMERYLAKFAPEYSINSGNIADTERNSQCPTQKKRKLTIEEISYWYPLRGKVGSDGKIIGYGTIAKQLGLQDKNIVRNSFKRYEQGKL